MTGEITKILIDTNIVIGLEDNKEITQAYTDFSALCSKNHISLCIHEAAIRDINRDKDETRKKISLSKIKKYKEIKRSPWDKTQKEREFGFIKSANDDVDTDLLVSLSLGVADILVTEDKGIHSRVKALELGQKVLRVDDALEYLQGLFEPYQVTYPHVEDKTCNQLDISNKFFNSLKEDYQGFEEWIKGCIRDERPCWVIDQNGQLGGLIIYKEESIENPTDNKELINLKIPGSKVLKLCLFKMSDEMRGGKYGEQLLKVAMDYAFKNNFDSTYLTTFPKQANLINLLKKFGFYQGGAKKQEIAYFKHTKVHEIDTKVLAQFEFHKKYWPCVNTTGANAYFVPVQPQFHDRLFPEIAPITGPQMELLGLTPGSFYIPGNAIRKVYICNSVIKKINPGSILFFYRSGDSIVTSVGILESFDIAEDLKSLKRYVGKRSVYEERELEEQLKKSSVKVLNFYYAENFENVITLKTLKAMKIAKGAPQSISKIPQECFEIFLSQLSMNDLKIFHNE